MKINMMDVANKRRGEVEGGTDTKIIKIESENEKLTRDRKKRLKLLRSGQKENCEMKIDFWAMRERVVYAAGVSCDGIFLEVKIDNVDEQPRLGLVMRKVFSTTAGSHSTCYARTFYFALT
jgi:hypothetical protein